jgi:Ca2+-binding EF-hand superfamily protein
MAENYVKDIEVQQCQDIIAEFDSSQDGLMNYDEFLNIVLPAASMSLREYCLYSKRVPSYYNDPNKPLSVAVSSMVVRILERERNLSKKRSEARMALFKNQDHQKLKTFHSISRGQTAISMSDLIYYLEQNGFHPRTEDLEAILRRCDHDADRYLSYEEFCELVEMPAEENEEGEEDPDAKANMNSPERKELQESVKQAEPLKRRNSNEKLDGQPKESMEESVARKEHEQRLEEAKNQRIIRYGIIGKLQQFTQGKMTNYQGLDLQKKILSYHSNYNAMELFREMDKDNNGYVTIEEFT